MQCGPGVGEELAAAGEIEHVVAVAPVGGAAVAADETAVAQAAQVVGDQVLRAARELAQLADPAVALRQLAQQPPAERVAGEAEELRRCGRGATAHADDTSNGIDVNSAGGRAAFVPPGRQADWSSCSRIAACAAASRAIGTRNGEQET